MSDETRRLITSGLDQWQIAYTDEQIDQLLLYSNLLIDWNQRINLTRISSPSAIAVEHFLDSLSLLAATKVPKNSFLIDVGAGAGFPSLPLKIIRPDLKVTLLEATAKKLKFCQAVVDALGLQDTQLMHGRAETMLPQMLHRFDIVTARAVAPLGQLLAWCEPYLRTKNGFIAAFKGAKAEEELTEAREVCRDLKLRTEIKSVVVPGSDRRHAIILCRKLLQQASLVE